MCGSATLAMVVSSDCMRVASITQRVIPPRLGVLGLSSSATAAPRSENGPAARVARVDADLHAHAGPQWRHVAVAGIDGYAQRNALHDLDPVAARVLSRQQRELLRGRRADARDGTVPGLAGIGVDLDADRLSRPHISQLSLLRVRVHPDVIR